MSDEQADKTAAPAKKPGRAKLILVAGAVLLLLLAGGGAAAFFMGILPIGAAAVAEQAQSEMAREDIVFVDLPELLVNLNVTGRRLHFLKIATALEVSGEEQAAVVRQFVPRILDSFHMYLRAITPEELQGSEGVYRLKEELLVRTNEAIRPAQVRDVLVREMLVQ
jgi:flagellar protein FliL